MDWPQNRLERKKSVARQNTCHQRTEKLESEKEFKLFLGQFNICPNTLKTSGPRRTFYDNTQKRY